jgi:phosphohistidine phosphatase
MIYLVRHGEAKPKSEDPQRGLTDAGRQAVERLASWAGAVGLRVDEIRHSGKRRAEQTAEILAHSLSPAIGPHTCPGLDPEDDVLPVAEALAGEPRNVMIVGHLPFLDYLVAQLVAGDFERGLVLFEPATLVRLLREDEDWLIDCVVHPGLL